MSLSFIATTLGLICALGVASQLEGANAMGAVGGYLFGASVGLTAALWLKHTVRTRPERALRALLEGFYMYIVGLLLAAFCLRGIAVVGDVAAWRPFIVSYLLAALIILFCSTLECSRALKGESAL